MLRYLFQLHEASQINRGTRKCSFPETLIFNEGWLLRAVLQEWKNSPRASQFDFLPFPDDGVYYSEGQLRTPFRARTPGRNLAEFHSHVDGIVGHFSIKDTKSGIKLDPGFQYVAIFEAKMFSRLAKGTNHASDYDQVSRLAACLIHNILQAPAATGYQAYLVVAYAQGNRYVRPDLYDKGHIAEQIAPRLRAYEEAGKVDDGIVLFTSRWREVLASLGILFITWEQVLAEIGNSDLNRFYHLCKRFGGQFTVASATRKERSHG